MKRSSVLLRTNLPRVQLARQFAVSQNAPAKRLEGKVAIVTASTSGIGYAIAESLAENGARVVVSSRKEENVQKAVQTLTEKGLDVIGCACHVAKKEQREKLLSTTIDSYGKLDILVSNAGTNPSFGPVLKTPEIAWDKIFELNVKAAFLLAQEAYPHLLATKGSMLFNSSITGYNPAPVIGAYSISKTALLGLVKTLAIECAPAGVRVNGIAPGLIDTDFSAALTESDLGKEEMKNIPMRRIGVPSEIAGAAVFLCSDEASYVTGETIVIAGGQLSRL